MRSRALLAAAAALLAASALAFDGHEDAGWEDEVASFSPSLLDEVDRLDDVTHAFGRSLQGSNGGASMYSMYTPPVTTTSSMYAPPVTTTTSSGNCPINCSPETKRLLGRELKALLGVTETAIGIKKAIEALLEKAAKAQALADKYAEQCRVATGGGVYGGYASSPYGEGDAADYAGKPTTTGTGTGTGKEKEKGTTGAGYYPKLPVLGIPTVRYSLPLGSPNPCELAAKFAAEAAALRNSAEALAPKLAKALAQGSALVAKAARTAEACRIVVTLPGPIVVTQPPTYVAQQPVQSAPPPQYTMPVQSAPYQMPVQSAPYQMPVQSAPYQMPVQSAPYPGGGTVPTVPTAPTATQGGGSSYGYPPTTTSSSPFYPPPVESSTSALLACLRRLDDLLESARALTRRALKLVAAAENREGALAAAEAALQQCLNSVVTAYPPYFPPVTTAPTVGSGLYGRYLAEEEVEEGGADGEADHDEVHAAGVSYTTATPPCLAERARVNALAQEVCDVEVALFSAVADLVRTWAAIDQTAAVCFAVASPPPVYYPPPVTTSVPYQVPVSLPGYPYRRLRAGQRAADEDDDM